MTHRLTRTYGDISVTVEGEDQVEVLKKLAFYDDIMVNRKCVGFDENNQPVSSDKTIFTYRMDGEGNEYLGMRCVEPKSHPLSWFQAAIGKFKKPKGMVFFNQKVPEGQRGVKGWYRYQAPNQGQGGGQSVQTQQSEYNPPPQQNSYAGAGAGEADIPF